MVGSARILLAPSGILPGWPVRFVERTLTELLRADRPSGRLQVARASRVLAIASSRSRTFLRRLFRRDAEINTRSEPDGRSVRYPELPRMQICGGDSVEPVDQ